MSPQRPPRLPERAGARQGPKESASHRGAKHSFFQTGLNCCLQAIIEAKLRYMAILWGAESASRNPQPSGPKKPRPAAQPGGAIRPRIRALSLRLAKGKGPNPGPDCGPRFGRGSWLSGAARWGVPGGRFCTPQSYLATI